MATYQHYIAQYPNGSYKDALISDDSLEDNEPSDYFVPGYDSIEHQAAVEIDSDVDFGVLYSE